MQSAEHSRAGGNFTMCGVVALLALLSFHVWGVTVGWQSKYLAGGEFRQAQTAISAYFIQAENNFSLAYPTPVLGQPWSVPMEFPLYQWSAVLLSNGTGLDLTTAGRSVSLACFYLTLPGFFLLLGCLGVPPGRRVVALGLILTCPLYIFYARTFLIETMALMFSVWFLLAFIRAVETGGRWWLVAANLMGIGAGLVKVTTFMVYLLPAGAWALWILWRARSQAVTPGWKNFVASVTRIAGATVVPFGVTFWWIRFADATKALNPNAEFLNSVSLSGFNFGFAGARLSYDVWHKLWQVVEVNLVWPPVLALCAGLVLLVGRHRWRACALCLATYLGAALIFPQLYAWHDYYSVASGVLLMVALSFGLLALLETRAPMFVKWGVLLVVFGGQIWLYRDNLYRVQDNTSKGGSGLTNAITALTQPSEVIAMVGDDWSSIVPYYARRRAMMIRNGMEYDQAYMTRAFQSLKGVRVGALVLPQARPGFPGILEFARQELGIDPRPVLEWHGFNLYLNAARRDQALSSLRQLEFPDVKWMSGFDPVVKLMGDAWFDCSQLRLEQRSNFSLMQPQPVSFKSTHGIGLGTNAGRAWFFAHPDTGLRFWLTAGNHRLHVELMLDAASYDPSLPVSAMTDGIHVDVKIRLPDGQLRLLTQRIISPATNEADRGPQTIESVFKLEQAGELELFIGPGPNGSPDRDWALLGPVRID